VNPGRKLFIYDGRCFLGTILIDHKGKSRAFDAMRKRVETFLDQQAALAAFHAAELPVEDRQSKLARRK
jgi:hypothetical protein